MTPEVIDSVKAEYGSKVRFVTLSTLIQVLRVLNQLQVMNAFEVRKTISPLELAKEEQSKRKRARNSSSNTSETYDW